MERAIAGTCLRFAGYGLMTAEPAPPGKTETTDNSAPAVKVRGGVELGTMRWVLILGIGAAILAMIGAAAGVF